MSVRDRIAKLEQLATMALVEPKKVFFAESAEEAKRLEELHPGGNLILITSVCAKCCETCDEYGTGYGCRL